MKIGSRMYRVVAVMMFAALVQACQSKPGSDGWFSSTSARDISQYYTLICRQYGFERGTTEMAQCIQKEINAQKQRNAIKKSAAVQANSTLSTGGSGSGISIVLRETFN